MLSAQALSDLRKEFRAFLKVEKGDGSKILEQKIETQENNMTAGDCMTEFQRQIYYSEAGHTLCLHSL